MSQAADKHHPAKKRRLTVSRAEQTRSDISLLTRRAGFGDAPAVIATAAQTGLKATVHRLVDYEATPDPFTPPAGLTPDLKTGVADGLTVWWLNRMVTTTRPLQEKMVLFWHGHFATAIQKVRRPHLMYVQNQLFRDNALGRFDDLLSAVYKDPAMLIWLDGWRNARQAPNENWGREVMELFTLGHGNYSEDDVHANSRAFTGWTLDSSGQPVYVPRRHDDGVKTLLGQTGNWAADDAVRILCAHPATGPFLAGKLWRFFASDQVPTAVVKDLSAVYYLSDHSIREMVRTLFSLPAFYSTATRSGHIKSPVEFLVEPIRQLGLQNVDLALYPRVLATLGQGLFNPPNVGGWPGGSTWINAATMLSRFNFAARFSGDIPRLQGTVLDTDSVLANSGADTMDQVVTYVTDTLGILLTGSTSAALHGYAGRGLVDSAGLAAKIAGVVHLALISPEYQAS